MRAWLCVVLVAAACGHPGNADDQDAGSDAVIDAPGDPGLTTLIQRTWTLPAHYEQYLCRVLKVQADMYISGYHLLAPTGTHHTILSITNSTTPGDSVCTPAPQPTMLYAGGINTNDIAFPSGVAIKLAKDQYIKLELHLYNPSDAPISGTSGLQVKTMAAGDVINEGDMVFLGNIGSWSLAPTGTNIDIPGSCRPATSWHLFQLWPHMHTYGTHQKVIVRRVSNGLVETLVDQSYDVHEQRMYAMQDMLINTNDQLEVTCSYTNTTNITSPPGYTIYQGDGSTDEKCLTGLLKYPKGGTEYQCASL